MHKKLGSLFITATHIKKNPKNYNIYTFLIIFPKVKHGKETQSCGVIQGKILILVTKFSEKICHTIFSEICPYYEHFICCHHHNICTLNPLLKTADWFLTVKQ